MVYLQSSSAVSNGLRALHIFDAFYYFSLPPTFMNSLIYKLCIIPNQNIIPSSENSDNVILVCSETLILFEFDCLFCSVFFLVHCDS